jgi:hypothetical protein
MVICLKEPPCQHASQDEEGETDMPEEINFTNSRKTSLNQIKEALTQIESHGKIKKTKRKQREQLFKEQKVK